MVLIENFRVLSCTHGNLDRYRGYKQIQVILIFQILFTGSFVFVFDHDTLYSKRDDKKGNVLFTRNNAKFAD